MTIKLIFKSLFALFLVVIQLQAQAQGLAFRHLARSPRCLLMGDACTARASDEFSLFYNPAALARSRGFEISPLNFSLEGSNILEDQDRFEDFPSDASAIADRVLDFPVYTRLSGHPGVKIGSFGLSLIANNSLSMSLQNRVHPILDIDYRYDRGFIAGYAHSWGEGSYSIGEGFGQGHRFSFGLSLKHIQREGLEGQFSFFGTQILSAISNSSDYSEIRKNLGFSKGDGFGWDIGFEHSYSSNGIEWSNGFSILDVGDTRFKVTEGAFKLPRQEMAVNLGTAFTQRFWPFHYTISADLHPLNSPLDFRSKLHVGLEVGAPLLTGYFGWASGYSSYGLMTKIWPLSIGVGYYSVEAGPDFRSAEQSRLLFFVNLLDIKIDI